MADSLWSLWSEDSMLSMASKGSFLSIGSVDREGGRRGADRPDRETRNILVSAALLIGWSHRS